MKKQNIIYGLLVLIMIISSCSSSDDDSNITMTDLKPSKYAVVEYNGNSWILNFEYSGNLITKITADFGTTIRYNYSSGQLTSYESTREGEPNVVTNLTYEDGKLIESRTNDDTEIINYYYNSIGQINNTVWNESGGIVTSTFYQYDSFGNVSHTEGENSTSRYLHDNKNNAFKNVFPQIDAGVHWPWFGSLINNEIEVQRKLSTETEFSTQYTYEYDYNENDYPIERRQIRLDGTVRERVTYEY